MNITYKDRLTAGLLAMGWNIDQNGRSKYTEFYKDGVGVRLFVGYAGALRKGQCASRSWSIGDPGNQTPIYLKVLNYRPEPNLASSEAR